MNKAELLAKVSAHAGSSVKEAEAHLEALLDTITREVLGPAKKVTISGLGTFTLHERAARTARNPATGATVKVKKTKVVKWRPAAELKRLASGEQKIAPAKKVASAKIAPAKAPAKPAVKATPVKRVAAAKAPAKVAAKKTAPAKTVTKAAVKKAPAKKAPAKRAR